MYSVGLDIHLMTIAVCILDRQGNVVLERTLRGGAAEMLVELAGLLPKRCQICFEVSEGYGFWYEALAERVVAAHPGHLRLIFRSKRKNDRIDARKLAKLLYLDEVPQVFVPGQDIRAWRRLVTFRDTVVTERTRIKNRLRGQLRRYGITAPRGKALWSRKGLAWLQSLEFAEPGAALERDLNLEALAHQSSRLTRVERELDAIAARQPAVALLRTIPGVGPRTAEAAVAWIADPKRFKRGSIGSYFGLVPSEDASADRAHKGHITRQGPAVARRLLIEAAWQRVKRDPDCRADFERVVAGDPDRRKVAIVAVGHQLTRQMLGMLKNQTPWRGQTQAA